jgi:hypothetical protein
LFVTAEYSLAAFYEQTAVEAAFVRELIAAAFDGRPDEPAACRVHIDEQQAGHRDGNIGVWPFASPGFDSLGVDRCFEMTSGIFAPGVQGRIG